MHLLLFCTMTNKCIINWQIILHFYYMFRHYCVILRELVVSTLPSYTSTSNAVAGNTIPFFLWRCYPTQVMAFSFLMFLDHTQRRTTFGRTALDEWSARRRDLHLTARNTYNRQISMSPVGFEPTISAGERPQTYALGRAATGTGVHISIPAPYM